MRRELELGFSRGTFRAAEEAVSGRSASTSAAEADVIAITEFRAGNEGSLRSHLERIGYTHIVTLSPVGNQNGLLVATRQQFEIAGEDASDLDAERWLPIRLPDANLDVLLLHIPGAPDNKFQDGYGISGEKRKGTFGSGPSHTRPSIRIAGRS